MVASVVSLSLSPSFSLSLSPLGFSSFLIFSQRNQSLVCFPMACAWVDGAWLELGCWRERWKECAPGCALEMETPSGQQNSHPGPLCPRPPEPASQRRPTQTPNRQEQLPLRALMSALGYVAGSANQPTERRLLPGEPGLPFLLRRCCDHQQKRPSQEALLPASLWVKFREGTRSWSTKSPFLQKQI